MSTFNEVVSATKTSEELDEIATNTKAAIQVQAMRLMNQLAPELTQARHELDQATERLEKLVTSLRRCQDMVGDIHSDALVLTHAEVEKFNANLSRDEFDNAEFDEDNYLRFGESLRAYYTRVQSENALTLDPTGHNVTTIDNTELSEIYQNADGGYYIIVDGYGRVFGQIEADLQRRISTAHVALAVHAEEAEVKITKKTEVEK